MLIHRMMMSHASALERSVKFPEPRVVIATLSYLYNLDQPKSTVPVTLVGSRCTAFARDYLDLFVSRVDE